jgi:hypothetical protein
VCTNPRRQNRRCLLVLSQKASLETKFHVPDFEPGNTSSDPPLIEVVIAQKYHNARFFTRSFAGDDADGDVKQLLLPLS